jgi:hypothetical protein
MFPKQITFKHGNSTIELESVKKGTEEIAIYIYKDMEDEREYSKAGMKLELTLKQIEKMKSNFTI